MADTFSRIYQLQTAGVDKVLTDVNAVIARLEVLGQVKNKISNSDIGDPAEVAALNNQYNNLVATVDKMAKSQEGLGEALAQVIELQKGVTMSMKEGSLALGQNVSAGTAGLTKLQGAFAVTNDMAAQMARTSTELGERLAVVKDNIAATSIELNTLMKDYAKGMMSEEEYAEAGGQLNIMLIEQRAESQYLTQVLKAQAIAQDTLSGSVRDARAQVALLNREQENLIVLRTKDVTITDEEIAANIARRDAIIAEKNALHDFLAANADKNLGRILNIGNYPTVSAEISQLRQDMINLVLAGEKGSAAFAEMQGRSIQLAAAIKEVDLATKENGTTMGKFSSIVERMGLRMIANLLIFQAAISAATYLYDAWMKDSKAAEALKKSMDDLEISGEASATKEAATAQNLANIASNINEKMDIRLRAVKELQATYPDYLGNLSQEAILTGQTADAMERLADALLNKAAMDASLSKIGELGKAFLALNKELAIEEKRLRQEQEDDLKKSGLSPDEIEKEQAIEPVFNATTIRLTNKINDLKAQAAQLLKDAKDFALNAGELAVDRTKDKKGKQPHDYTNAEIEAQKKLTDAIAKEKELQLQLEMAQQKEIFDNVEKSLGDRLKAYAIYARDEKQLLQIANDAQVKDVQDKLNRIAAIEKKPLGKRTVEEQTLLINKPQLLKQLDDISADLKLKLQNVSTSINSDIAGITRSSLETEFKNIDAELNRQLGGIADKYGIAKEELYKSKHSDSYKDKHIKKLGEGESVEGDEAKLLDDKQKISATELAIQQAHNDKEVQLEADLHRQLVSLYKQEADDKAKYQNDVHKKDDDAAALTMQTQEAVIQVATSYANDYMQLLEKQDAYKQHIQQQSMDWNQKQLNSEAQSNQEKLRQDKAYYIAQQQAEKEKAITEKKRAEAQALIDYASAALSLIPKAIKEGGVPSVIIQEAALAAIFAGKEAALQSAPTYAQGTTNHPGGFAYVGDGGEPELIKIGNKLSVSPSTSTLVNLPSGATVTPFSQLGGNLKAPSFNVGNNTGGGDSGLQSSVMGLHSVVAGIAAGLQHMQVNLDPHKAQRSINNTYYRQVKV